MNGKEPDVKGGMTSYLIWSARQRIRDCQRIGKRGVGGTTQVRNPSSKALQEKWKIYILEILFEKWGEGGFETERGFKKEVKDYHIKIKKLRTSATVITSEIIVVRYGEKQEGCKKL